MHNQRLILSQYLQAINVEPPHFKKCICSRLAGKRWTESYLLIGPLEIGKDRQSLLRSGISIYSWAAVIKRTIKGPVFTSRPPSTCSKMNRPTFALALLAGILMATSGVAGHGSMFEPPQRASLWRYGYDSPVNERDDFSNDFIFLLILSFNQSFAYSGHVQRDQSGESRQLKSTLNDQFKLFFP